MKDGLAEVFCHFDEGEICPTIALLPNRSLVPPLDKFSSSLKRWIAEKEIKIFVVRDGVNYSFL
jgi:hypothetical protein